MANPNHLAILEKGVNVWNKWLDKNTDIVPDLSEANLEGANLDDFNFDCAFLYRANLAHAHLRDVDLRYACLIEANLNDAKILSETELIGADLTGAELIGAFLIEVDLTDACLCDAKLNFADLSGARLKSAKLNRADLSGVTLVKYDINPFNFKRYVFAKADFLEADLREVNLTGVDLREYDMTGWNLFKSNLTNVDLRRISLIDAILDGATLTGAKLWETNRSGWSIKDAICEYAYFDRDGVVKTEFKPGEFEKLYSEQTKIVLHYEDGMTQFEVTTLPALIQFIESRHPGSSLRLRTIGEDAGGASVTVAVDELGDADLSILREDFEKYKKQIREEVQRDTQIEMIALQREVKLLTGIIERKMGDTFNIQQVTGVVKAESSTVNQTINTNDLDAVSKLISDILAARPEIEKVLPSEKAGEFNAAFEIIQEQASAPQKNFEKMKQAAQSVKNVLMSTGEVAGKWIPIVEKLAEAAHKAGMV